MGTVNVILVKNTHYPHDKDIKNLMRYIAGETEEKEKVRYCGGKGVPKKQRKAADRMIAVQKYFRKTNKRRVYHWIVSFPEYINDVNCIKIIAENIADIFFEKYQVYYGIHEDTDNLHIHLAVNAVSYVDGLKWHKSKKEFELFKCKIQEETENELQELL